LFIPLSPCGRGWHEVPGEGGYNELKMENGKWKIVLNIFDVVFGLFKSIHPLIWCSAPPTLSANATFSCLCFGRVTMAEGM